VIDPDNVNQKAAELERLLQDKLALRGRSLAALLGKGARALPRHARRAGHVVATAEARMKHPRLARLVDQTAVQRAHVTLRDHLRAIDPKERRKIAVLQVLGGLVLNLILLASGVAAIVWWQG